MLKYFYEINIGQKIKMGSGIYQKISSLKVKCLSKDQAVPEGAEILIDSRKKVEVYHD